VIPLAPRARTLGQLLSVLLARRKCWKWLGAALVGPLAVVPLLASPAGAATVRVQRGQTLTAIAARYHTTVAALAAANGLRDPNRVLAGTVLQIPVPRAGPSATATTATGRVVTVAFGQTLTAIAARYGVPVAILASFNGISDPDHVLAGSRLTIPPASGVSGLALASYTIPADSPAVGNLPTQLAAHPERLGLAPLFEAAAARSGVPAAVLEAMCWWESGWQAAIVSSTGAIGVCQLEPATVTFTDTYIVGAPLDPHVAAQNIDLGAAYLAWLLRATAGDVSTALAGYYQGLLSVRQRGMFPDTANYVKGIEAYAAIFAR
jgi:LysM repeat protein